MSLKKYFDIPWIHLFYLTMTLSLYYVVKSTLECYNENVIPCRETKYGCCKIYDECKRPHNDTYLIDYTIYYIDMIQHSREGYNCLDMGDIIKFYNRNYDGKLYNTGNGKCKANNRCDTIVRNFFNYHYYEQFEKYHLSERSLRIYKNKAHTNCPSNTDMISFYNIHNSF